jgi:hypothetical protein
MSGHWLIRTSINIGPFVVPRRMTVQVTKDGWSMMPNCKYILHIYANWLELMGSTLTAIINMSVSMGVVLGEQVGVTTGQLPPLIPDFLTFQLIIHNDCFPARSHQLLIYPSPLHILRKEENSIMYQDHIPHCRFKSWEYWIILYNILGHYNVNGMPSST